MSDIKLPEPYSIVLEGWGSHGQCTRDVPVYTAEQAEAYAEARAAQAAELERERCEQECELVELEAMRMAKEGGTAVDDGRALGARECIDAIRGTK